MSWGCSGHLAAEQPEARLLEVGDGTWTIVVGADVSMLEVGRYPTPEAARQAAKRGGLHVADGPEDMQQRHLARVERVIWKALGGVKH